MRQPMVLSDIRGAFICATLCLAALGCTPPSPSPTPAGDYRPLAVYYIGCGPAEDCFGHVTPQEAPKFVLYADGLAIYWDLNRDLYAYWMAILSPSQLRALWDSLGFDRLDSMPPDLGGDCEWQHHYTIETWTAGTHRVHLACGARTTDGTRGRPPRPFLSLFDTLSHFRHPNGHPWVPTHLRVMWFHVDSSASASYCRLQGRRFHPQNWPDTWQAPRDSGSAGTEPIFTTLAGTELERLAQMVLREYPDCTPILARGRYWAVDFTYAFPADSMWLR